MLKKIIIAIVVLIVLVLGYAATRPDSFRVEQKVEIKASPDKIFALIEDFHKWDSWSPWKKLDPNAKLTYSGAESGKGAIFEWEGNSKAGKGRAEITDTVKPSKIIIKTDIVKPFSGHSIEDFDLNTKGNVTTVTWTVHVSKNYMAKLAGLFFNCEKMMNETLAEGLNNLKTVAEK